MGSTASGRSTLYLRGMPTGLVREAKGAAARRGETLALFVSEALSNSLRGREAAPRKEDEDDLRADMEWYEVNRAKLSARYAGEYVAIVEGAVVGHDSDFEALASRAFARFGVRSIYMPLVAPEEPRARVRSPRRARH